MDTGELLWEHRINLYMSDVPPHRVAWASPVADPGTGNVYAFTVSGTLIGFTPEGKVLWTRSLNEEFGLITTHGGRTQSPVVEGDLVIVSGLSSGWGDQARGGHRFFAFHKTTGETYWVSSPGGQPYDTVYAPLYATEVDGTRILMTGGGDGSMLAVKPQTGEPVWRFEFSKRGVNTGAIEKDGIVVVSQGEENLHTSEMGLLAAIDARARGDVKIESAKWKTEGFLAAYSTPTLDGDRFYVIDIGANLGAFDFATGKELWRMNIGHTQRASPVVADGKIYVGSVGGTFYILEPRADGATVLDRDELGTPEAPEEIYASAAISGGRVYLASTTSLYAIGSKERKPAPPSAISTLPAGTPGEPAYLQLVPTEVDPRARKEPRSHRETLRRQGTIRARDRGRALARRAPRRGVGKELHARARLRFPVRQGRRNGRRSQGSFADSRRSRRFRGKKTSRRLRVFPAPGSTPPESSRSGTRPRCPGSGKARSW